MRFAKAFGRFWYDFVIGDDWKIAVAVVSALGVTLLVVELTSWPDAVLAPIGGLAVLAAFAISLLIDVRAPKRPVRKR